MGKMAIIAGLAMALAARAEAQGGQKSAGRYPATQPIQATVRLDTWMEESFKHQQPTTHHASVEVGVEQTREALHTIWPASALKDAGEETKRNDKAQGAETPTRKAIQDLDPARIQHLLNQESILEELVQGATLREESTTQRDGLPTRLKVFSFKPRLSPYDATYLRQATGLLRLWTLEDGTPLVSESTVEYFGKTSRFFGRIQSTTKVETHYQIVRDRLIVSRRSVEEFRSTSDGAEVTKSKLEFVLHAN
jgi:hypothetical protein